MLNKIQLIEINQPIGTFYVGKIKSHELIKITKVVQRKQDIGIQRQTSKKRIDDIVKYCSDPDATFPTPIILAIKEEDLLNTDSKSIPGLIEVSYDDLKPFAEILDGQHRVEGIRAAKNMDIELLVVLMFNLTEEEKAYVFSTINSNQTKVDKSLIYDLFDLSTERSPYKTCHEIARIMNLDKNSPFYQKLKMLGKKNLQTETLSQGTFVSYLVKLISSNPKEDMITYKRGRVPKADNNIPLRKYFLGERDDIILKLLTDYFNAVREVFPTEWDDNQSILSKTTGYGAMIIVFKKLYNVGLEKKVLSKEFFISYLEEGKRSLLKNKLKLTSKDFPSNEQTQRTLASYFINNTELEAEQKN